MENDFADKNFTLKEACENRWSGFLSIWSFYESSIMKSLSRLQQIIEQNSAYMT